jgi:molecular chaperone Hsp33
MTDIFQIALLKEHGLSIGIARTSLTCREATRLHDLKITSQIALGRLLTSTAIVGLMQESRGALSMQIISSGRFKQVYADVTAEGHLRGYVDATDLQLPLLSTESAHGRRSIAPGFGPGHLSVIRNADVHNFVQSNTELIHREVDTDVLHYLETSDQNASALRAEVLLDDNSAIDTAGGIAIQSLPHADAGMLEKLRERLQADSFPEVLRAHLGDFDQLLSRFCPEATWTTQPTALKWKCRCSQERVTNALRMLSPDDLGELVNDRKAVSLDCQFCSKSFTVSPEKLEQVFTDIIIAQGTQKN